jgi:tetratricopeptide (TPR) repeat protein
VQLDPGNAEAWTWLGNLLLSQNRLNEALYAHDRAVSIEPLWWTAVGNKIGNLILAGDQAGLARELGRIRQTQDEVLLAKARYRIAELTGNPGEAVQILLQLRFRHPEESAAVDQRLAAPLIQLGFIEEGLRAGQMPMEVAPALRGTPPPAAQIDQEYRTPADFWLDNQRLVLYARLLPDGGRLPEFVRRYKAAFKSPDEFMAMFAQRLPILQHLAPTVVANLRAAGDNEDADAILRRTEPAILQQLRNGPPRPDLLALLAYYKGAEPNDDEAVRLLKRAVDGGWLPDYFWSDIATEPAFARLAGRADFQAVRQRILARIAEQRRRVNPAELARAGLELKLAA